MKSRRKRVHLVCHAHLDPVWLWRWEDALAEAIATFRSACRFCEEMPGFIFCHNEALLYEWVERHDPVLFERIQKHVRAGRWHIAGGSYVQPDVNLPSGESHIRQFLCGKEYFRDKFDGNPTTAYNFDSFGHAEGYVGILAGCGFESYIFCRPDSSLFRPELNSFRWRDRSGAEVLARRVAESYPTKRNAGDKLEQWMPRYAKEPVGLFLWGVGNHGGGPSREDWQQIQEYAKGHPKLEFVHSTPERFFDELRRSGADLPVITGEMQNIFPGCYTSMSRIKRAHRACESLLTVTERMAAMAWWLGNAPYPQADLDAAWRDVLFGEFHDILPGTCVPSAEKDSLGLFAHASETLRRAKTRLFVSLLRDEKAAPEGATPIFVWNPHSFPVETDLGVEFHYDHLPSPGGTIKLLVHDGNGGADVPFQSERPEASLASDLRMKVAVAVEMKPFEMRCLEVSWERRKRARPWRMPEVEKHLAFRSRHIRIEINPKTGLIDFAAPAGRKESWLAKDALEPVILQDVQNAWSCGDPRTFSIARDEHLGMRPWKSPVARFRLCGSRQLRHILSPPSERWHEAAEKRPLSNLRIVEHGRVRTIIEAVFTAKRSVIIRRYVFSRRQPWVEVRDRVFWNEKDRMLKLALPLGFHAAETVSETPYSAVTRPAPPRHVDYPNQRWVAARQGERGRFVATLNDSSHAHSLWRDTLYLNVLRSPPHATMWLRPNLDAHEFRYWPRQDQGEHEVRFRVMFGEHFDETTVSRAAQVMNVPPDWMVFFPNRSKSATGKGASPPAFIEVAPDHVQVAAVKRAENGRGLIVRLWEQKGEETEVVLRLAGVDEPVVSALRPFGLKTLRISRKARGVSVKETNLIEDVL